MPGPIPDRHLGTRCGRSIDKPGSPLGYPCTLPQGHDTRPPDDPEPHYAVEIPAAVHAWQLWKVRNSQPDSSTRAARPMADPDMETSTLLNRVEDPNELDDGAHTPVDPDGPHEHDYRNGSCIHCGNPGENWESATLSEGERAWFVGDLPVHQDETVALEVPRLRTPEQWEALVGYRIYDPDGWRGTSSSDLPSKDWHEPIDFDEFQARMALSTTTKYEVPTKQREGDQPLPTKNDQPDIQSLVILDIEERRRVGISRYGTALQPFNGRDVILDAYEEAMDLCMYLKQMMVERDSAQ